MLSTSRIRLLLVDDHDSVRFSLGMYLSTWKDIDVVGEAADGQLAIAQFQKLKPDVVLMDMHMPEMNGIEATKAIIQLSPVARILILTSIFEPDLWDAAQAVGALAYVFKALSGEEIVNAVRKVHHQ